MPKPNDPGAYRGDTNKEPLDLKVAFEGKPDRPIELTAYAFDTNGALLASAPVKGEQTQLSLTRDQAMKARIFFAAPPEPTEKITLETMARLRAYEPALRRDPAGRAFDLLPIPESAWKLWLWCRCRVRGRVVKPVTIGGVTYNKPVCNARVHICEVDRLYWLIPLLPDDILRRLRDELLRVIVRPWPIPEPDPPPFRFDPSVIDPSPINVARMLKSQANEFKSSSRPADNPSTIAMRSLESDAMLNPQPLPPQAMLADLPLATRSALMSSSTTIVRQALLDNIAIIRPWICLWPWIWPYFCLCDEITTVITDHQGRFETDIWYPCFGDHPDLHFWVEYCIGGVWTTVYSPPACCDTYWNYACGSEVIVRVTDPRVPWCGDDPPLPGKQVAVLSIGHTVSMTEIQRQSAAVNEGLTNDAQPRPFGGSLEPHVWFGDALVPPTDGALSASGITHYRWSYHRIGSLADWTPLDHEVIRHYGEIMADSTLVFRPFTLGPDPAFVGQNLFKIRPANPPLNPGAASSSWAPEVNARDNTASAYFLSHLLGGGDPEVADGKYELKLELFKSDGSLVNFTDEAVLLKVPTVDAPFVGVVPTQLVAHSPALPGDMEDRVIRDGAGKIVAFRVVLHVDNNPCNAEIEDVTVNGIAAGPCGFVSYTPGSDAIISFIARHPHNFATFNFRVDKGSSGLVAAASASGSVVGPVVNGFTRNAASLFTKNVPVATLLGTCIGKAAFAETLHVDAIATDGWSTLDYLDGPATPKAFALEPV